MRAAALDLARRGFRVFRVKAGCKGGKGNYPDGGVDFASADVAKVWDWWTNDDGSTADYNVAVAGGGDLVVLDVDHKVDPKTGEVLVDGFLSLPNLGDLPPTFRVRTPSGGEHIYFHACGQLFGQARPETGIDVRAVGGYVIGPGSVFKGKRYEIIADAAAAPIPEHVAERLRIAAARAASAGSVLGELDTPASKNAATRYLQLNAPHGLEGDRDDNCFKVACRVVDFGLSEDTTYALMEEHWPCDYTNEGPNPFTFDDLRRCVWSAYNNRKQAIGIDSPAYGFRPVPHIPDFPSEFESGVWSFDLTLENTKTIPVRPWLAYRRLLRGKITSLVAPGSAGKSLLSAQWAAAITLGNGDFCGLQVADRANTLIVNNEDETDEVKRRLAAIFQHFNLDFERARDRIFVKSGVQAPFKVVRKNNNGRSLSQSRELGELIKFVKARDIGFVVVDPLVTTYEGEENSNSDSEYVMQAYRRLAVETNAAVMIVHHTRKPPAASADSYAGNMDAGRGAGAVIAAARVGLTLFGMSEKDAEQHGIPLEDRNRYARLDDAKQNLTLALPFADWFIKPSVKIGNGEELGVMVPTKISHKAEAEARAIAFALYEHLERVDEMKLKTAAQHLIGDPMFCSLGADAAAQRVRKIFEAVPRVAMGADEIRFAVSGKEGGAFRLLRNVVN